jgi:hypothetical protein
MRYRRKLANGDFWGIFGFFREFTGILRDFTGFFGNFVGLCRGFFTAESAENAENFLDADPPTADKFRWLRCFF